MNLFIVSREAPSRIHHLGLLLPLALALTAFGRPVAAADWPEFRGPRGDGQVNTPGDANRVGLPLYWSETNNIKWKTAIPSPGSGVAEKTASVPSRSIIRRAVFRHLGAIFYPISFP